MNEKTNNEILKNTQVKYRHLNIDDIFDKRFLLVNLLESDFSGELWKVREQNISNFFYLKLLSKIISNDPKFIQELREIISNVSILNHDSLLKIYSLEGNCDIGHYIVMENPDGCTLKTFHKKFVMQRIELYRHSFHEFLYRLHRRLTIYIKKVLSMAVFVWKRFISRLHRIKSIELRWKCRK